MTTWTTIPNTAVAAGGRPRGSVITALRDNPVAISEGAAGAPRVLFAAVRDGIAGATYGTLGTYAFLHSDDVITPGTTVAGSTLKYSGAIDYLLFDNSGGFTATANALTSPAGTWRCMGRINPGNSGSATGLGVSSLFLRTA